MASYHFNIVKRCNKIGERYGCKNECACARLAFSKHDRFLHVLIGDNVIGFKAYSDGILSWKTTVNTILDSSLGLVAP